MSVDVRNEHSASSSPNFKAKTEFEISKCDREFAGPAKKRRRKAIAPPEMVAFCTSTPVIFDDGRNSDPRECPRSDRASPATNVDDCLCDVVGRQCRKRQRHRTWRCVHSPASPSVPSPPLPCPKRRRCSGLHGVAVAPVAGPEISQFALQQISRYMVRRSDVLSFELVCKTWKTASRCAYKRTAYVTLEDLRDLTLAGLSLKDVFPLVSSICVDLDPCPRCKEERDATARVATRAVLGCTPDAIKIVGGGTSLKSERIVSDICIAAGLRPLAGELRESMSPVGVGTNSGSDVDDDVRGATSTTPADIVDFVDRIFVDAKRSEEEEEDAEDDDCDVARSMDVRMCSASRIDVSECGSTTDADVRAILKFHFALETFSFARCPKATTASLLFGLTMAPRLRTLDASGNDFSRPMDAASFPPTERFGKSLIALSLNGCAMHGKTVAELVARCKRLVVADGSDVTDPQPVEFVDAIASLPELRAARFALWIHGSDAIARLGRAPKLEWLDVGDCVELDGEGLRRLLESRTLKYVVAPGRNAMSLPAAIEALDDAVQSRAATGGGADAGWDFSLIMSATEQRTEGVHVLMEALAPQQDRRTKDEGAGAPAAASAVVTRAPMPTIRIRNDVAERGQIEVCYESGELPDWTRFFFELSAAGSFACNVDSAAFRAARICNRMCKVHRG